MEISLDSIYIPPDKDARIREPENLAKAVTARSRSILRLGQLQAILVKKLDEPINGKQWELLDGQVRWTSLTALSVRHSMGEEEVVEAFSKVGLKPGLIEATTKENIDPITALQMEFHANEDRDNFTWEEKGRYIRRIHEMLQEKHGRKEWKGKDTAEYTGLSPALISQFLQLTDESDPAAQSDRVKKATTKGAALRQLKIEKERLLRKERVKKTTSGPDVKDVLSYAEAAKLAVYHGDCREWIKNIPDDSLAWFHWDPPYGGKEGRGGAFPSHEPIQTEHDYAISLISDMVPEIWRTLHDGAWMVLWFTPVHYEILRLLLQGHRFDSDQKCEYCGKHRTEDYVWLASNYTCRRSPARFWVNPYPNIWRKADRVADGHEITRFLTKETEYFFLAGKAKDKTPILLRSNRGNVFDFNMVPSESRRHIHHKPWALLSEILSLISVAGSLGGDAGSGSGSILEAAFNNGRKVIVSELDETYHESSLETAVKLFTPKKITPASIADWLAVKFTP